ncbi:MAG: ribonuclease R [Coriobacteriales bacterium]
MSRGRPRRSTQRHHRRQSSRKRPAAQYPSGIIEIKARGYAFVNTEEGRFYISAHSLHGALPGDLVAVRPHRGEGAVSRGGERTGSVARVLNRADEYLVGHVEISGPLTVVVPRDPRVRYDLFVRKGHALDAHEGDLVVARITTFPGGHSSMEGDILEILEEDDLSGADVDVIIHNAGLQTEFSPAALEQAAAIEPGIEAALAERDRHDLRERDVFTIDPVDARDFDDAVSIEHVEGVMRLGVHIADVSSYVLWGSPIDLDARERMTSAYLVDRVIPMLPEKLSNDVCSLGPGKERRTITVDMYIDSSGNVVRHEIYPSVIKSHRRFNYDEVLEILEGKQADPYKPKLDDLKELSEVLAGARRAKGALDFETVETRPVLDEEGAVERIEYRKKTPATMLIEEAMIAANATVATDLFERKSPMVYRVHGAPRPAALEELLPLLKELGYSIEGLGSGEPLAFQRVLDQAKGKPDEELVNYLVLRSMEQARYSTSPDPHFGLALEHYCHFTSPIRRYPDLMVHRLLRDPRAMQHRLDELADQASKLERVVEEVSRDSVALKVSAYMESKVGDVFSGRISSVNARGFWVRLENGFEGFVKLDYLHGERFDFKASSQVLIGVETKTRYRLAQHVEVRLDEVNVRDRSGSFSLV